MPDAGLNEVEFHGYGGPRAIQPERRPMDALANVQLGVNYVNLRKPDLAVKYLKEAKRLDPGHFSTPQLALYEIYLRSGDRKVHPGA